MTSAGDNLAENCRKTVLDSGIRIVTERMENVRSVAIGVWLETGSHDESPELNGISHFLEHMLFKGTEKRSALKIAREIEQVGGHMNAFTSKEATAYYAHLLDEHLPLAVDVLCDMVSNSTFPEKEVLREQGVVLEEIATAMDTPEDVIMDDYTSGLFPAHSLGRPIYGSPETVTSFNRDTVVDYWKSFYTADRLVVTAAGRVDHDQLVRLVEKKLSPPGKKSPRRPPFNGSPPLKGNFIRKKDITQAHICIGTRGIKFTDERRFAFFLMNTVLGMGMSSRLFQRIRERNGLAYSVFSFHESYRDSGMFGVYAGLEGKNIRKVEKMVREELDKLKEKPLSEVELKRTKAQLKGGLVLALENSSTRMHRLARGEIYFGEYHPLDEMLAEIDAVTPADIQEIAAELFSGELFTAYLLPENTRGR